MIGTLVRNKGAVFFLLLLVGLSIYAPAFFAPMQLDDTTIIKENYIIRSLDIQRIFRFDPSRFVTHLSFAVNYSLHQNNVFGYHLVNFLLHILNAFLAFLFLNRLLMLHSERDGQIWAVLGALIFLCHPLQTSAVTYIVQRSVLIAAACYIGALLLYIRLRMSFNWPEYVLLCAVVLIGMMSKPIIFTLPIAVILFECCYLRMHSAKYRVLLWVPFGCVLVAVPLLLLGFFTNTWGYSFDIKNLSLATRVSYDTPRLQYFYTQFFVWVRYLQLLCVPLQQSIYHVVDLAKSFTELRILCSLTFHAVLITSAVLLIKRNMVFLFSIFWFYILMIPEGTIFPLPDLMFEHRLYIVMLPFSALVVFVFLSLKAGRSLVLGALIIIVFGLSCLTFQRNMLWNNPKALLLDFAKRYPTSDKPFNDLGIHYLQNNQFAEAEEMFKTSIRLNSTYVPATLNLGKVYAKQENWPMAKKYFDQALRLNPVSYDVLVNLGDYYFRTGAGKDSAVHYQMALRIKPNQAYPLFKLGEIYLKSGRLEQSVGFYLQSLRASPLYEPAQYSLGNAYLEQERYQEAIATYQKLLRQNPLYADAYNTMGIAYVRVGRFRQAESAFLKALELKPDSRIIYLNLAQLYDKQGDKERAHIYQQMADQRRPDPENGE